MDSVKQQFLNTIKQYKYVALVLALGLLLMLLPQKDSQEAAPAQIPAQTAETPEEKLEQILSQIQGVGKVKVLLSVAQGEQVVYVVDEDRSDATDSDSLRRETVIVTDTERAQTGLISQVLPPTYLGAVIVCQGGDLPGVQLAVVEAVSDATGLTADKISVLKMK